MPPLPAEPRRPPRSRGSRRARLRRATLRLGAALGWAPAEVLAFTEALTGRPWARCDEAELDRVAGEFRALLRTVRRPPARRTARGPRATRPAPSGGEGDPGDPLRA